MSETTSETTSETAQGKVSATLYKKSTKLGWSIAHTYYVKHCLGMERELTQEDYDHLLALFVELGAKFNVTRDGKGTIAIEVIR